METLGNFRKQEMTLKRDKTFKCEMCNFESSQKSHLKRHFKTEKHKRMERDKKGIKGTKRDETNECPFCLKNFKTRSGKWKHMKKCSSNPKILMKKLEEANFLVEKLEQKIEEQEHEKDKLEIKHLKKTVEILEKHKGNTQNINTQNNNIINIQLYLNEKCKNAMPIMDFVKELQFKLTDIDPERPASTIESLTKCITDKLEDMDETERPVHCSDAKRLVFHVKDASGWTKDVNNKKIDSAIGWANVRHQGAWIKKAKADDWVNQKNDTGYLNMNVAMCKFSDNPKKAKMKIKRAIAKTVPIKDVQN